MDKQFKKCQSCGMPLSKSPFGGTNQDGSQSKIYRAHCFVNGEFTLPNCTAEEMQSRVKGKLKEFGFPGFIAGLFTKGIPKLERWNHK